MRTNTLTANNNVRYEIEISERDGLWTAVVHYEVHHPLFPFRSLQPCEIPGRHSTEASAMQVAYQFAIEQTSPRSDVLAGLNWIYKQRGVIFS